MPKMNEVEMKSDAKRRYQAEKSVYLVLLTLCPFARH